MVLSWISSLGVKMSCGHRWQNIAKAHLRIAMVRKTEQTVFYNRYASNNLNDNFESFVMLQ